MSPGARAVSVVSDGHEEQESGIRLVTFGGPRELLGDVDGDDAFAV